MSNETLFFVCGIALAVSAVLVSLAGLKLKDFPGKAFPLVVLWFALLVGGATTFAVLHAKDEDKSKAAELEKAGKEFEKEQSGAPVEGPAESGSAAGGGETNAAAKGAGRQLQLAADPSKLEFDKTELTSKPGMVTIQFDNPAPTEHNVAIEQNGEQIAVSELIAEGETSVTAELAPGTYTFLCTVPGHAEAGMEGTLTIR